MKVMRWFLVAFSLILVFGSNFYVALAAEKPNWVINYPEKPIQLVNPYSPGGATDVVFRAASKYAEQELGQPIVVVNMPGAAATVGSRYVKDAKPDGYTLLGSHDVIATAYFSGVADYAFEAFEPICNLTATPNICTTHRDYGWKTMRELLDYARTHPDEKIIWAVTFGSTAHYFILGILDAYGAGTDLLSFVEYQGTGPQLTALLGKHIHGCLSNVGTALSHVKAGDLRFIGLAWGERLKQIPDVPTLKEQGINWVHATNRGIFAPKGTPEDILAKIETAFEKAVNHPEFIQVIENTGDIINFIPRSEYPVFLDELMKKYEYLTDKFGLRSK